MCPAKSCWGIRFDSLPLAMRRMGMPKQAKRPERLGQPCPTHQGGPTMPPATPGAPSRSRRVPRLRQAARNPGAGHSGRAEHISHAKPNSPAAGKPAKPSGQTRYAKRPCSSLAAAALSKLPPVFWVSAPMTLPISFLVDAPVSASTASIRAASSSPETCLGR